MDKKHYLGLGLMLVGLTAGYELFSQKRNQQLIDAAGDAVAFEFEHERDLNDGRREREHEARLADTRDAVSEQFLLERERRELRSEQLHTELVEQTRTAAAAAVADQFRKEREINDARAQQMRNEHLAGAMLAEGLSMASDARMRIMEHYMQTDEMPNSNHEVGLPPAHKITGNAVQSMAVSFGGVITVTYKQVSGVRSGKVVLRPDADNGYRIRWSCESRSYESIARWMPQCRYTG